MIARQPPTCNEHPPVLRLAFVALDPKRPVIPLAAACNIGWREPRSAGIDAARFGALHEFARSRLRVVADPHEADLLVYPHNWDRDPGVAAAVNAAQASRPPQRPLALFCETDLAAPATLPPGCTLFRTSMFARRRGPYERSHPAWVLDPLTNGALQPRDHNPTPSVGFCGHTLHLRGLRYLAGRWPMLRGLWLRERILRALEASPAVRCDFVRRDHLIGPNVCRWRSDPAVATARNDFLRNLLATDYMLCIRGAGNFSIRFFETLAAGRIPLLIDTDCVLPLDDRIDWSRHVCRVPGREMHRAGEILRAFHDALGPGEFAAMQAANRRLYEQFLTPEHFYPAALAMAAGLAPSHPFATACRAA